MAEAERPKPEEQRTRISTPGGMFIRDMPVGTRLRLSNGAVVEIVMNANDGGWVYSRYLEHPQEPDMVGSEDWVFFGDVSEEL